MTPVLRSLGIAGYHDYRVPTRKEYLSALKKAKTIVNKMSEAQLDKLRGLHTFKKRLKAYSSYKWRLATVSPRELGVWKRSGGLPTAWTRGTLVQTAKFVKRGLEEGDRKIRKRARRAIPIILGFSKIIKRDKFLFPIVFVSGSGTNGRKGMSKTKYDIDDGSMRSIALTISGDKMLNVYIGNPK